MIRKTLNESFVVLILALKAVVYTGTALAQSKVEPEEQLQEVVVTATKRETTVQNTPISITAVTGEEIQERGIADFNTLMQSVPGVSMRTGGPGETEFEMRGMPSTGGNVSTVGLYLYDAPLAGPIGEAQGKITIDPNLYDLNRVEVLRGPQGTLYGAGSMGGTVKIVPNAPNLAAFDSSGETIFSATDGGGFNYAQNGMVNLPLGETIALRLVGTYSHDSGWISRTVIANGDFPLETNNLTTRGNVLAAPVAADYKGVNWEDLTSGRASLLWNPTDRLEITPSGFYERIQQGGLNDIDSVPGTNAHYQPFNTPEPFSDEFALGNLNVKYRFDDFDLTAAVSDWSGRTQISQDGIEEFQWAFSAPTAIFPFYASQGGIGNASSNLDVNNTQQVSGELRLTSSGNSSFQWLIGYFYSDFLTRSAFAVYFPGLAPSFGTANLYTDNYPTKLQQNSIFGNVSYQISPKWKATAGLRRYAYDSDYSLAWSGIFSGTGTNAYQYFGGGQRAQGLNPKFDLSYQLNQSLMLYASTAKGFRPGGGQPPITVSGSAVGNACEAQLQSLYNTSSFVPSPLSFDSDSVWSTEFGEKAKILDGRLIIDGDAYYANWLGVQQGIPLQCGDEFSGSAGNAHIYGAELEIEAILVRGLTVSANAGYTHSVIASSNFPTVIASGTPLQDIPDLTSAVSLSYRRNISDNLAFMAHIDTEYVGPRIDAGFTLYDLPPYNLTNLRAGVEGDRWKAVLFAKNLFNQRALLSDVPQEDLYVPTYRRIAVSQPLTVGIDLSYHFGR